MSKKEDDIPDPKTPTITQVQKTLVNFIEETRHNFSVMNSDREHDYKLWQQTNQNVTALEGKVDNLASSVNKLIDHNKQEDQRLQQKIDEKIQELRDDIAPKKVIVKKEPHFSLKLWWKNLWRKIF